MSDARLAPAPMVLRRAPDILVADYAVTVTLYLERPLEWATRWLAWVAERTALLWSPQVSPTPFTPLLWTSAGGRSIPLEAARVHEEVFPLLSLSHLAPKLRHLFELRLVDDVDAPRRGLVYRELDPEVSAQRSYLQLILDVDTDPLLLVDIFSDVAATTPLAYAAGGFAGVWNRKVPLDSFSPLYRWSKRYLALDLADPEDVSWTLSDGLPSSTWLTYISTSLAQELDLELGSLDTLRGAGLGVDPLPGGVLVRAGERPTLGDVNAMEPPTLLSYLHEVLAPHFATRPRAFPGAFAERGETVPWMRRLVDPDGWPP